MTEFDEAIAKAPIRPPTVRPGRIRRWLAICCIAMALAAVAHIIAADPIGRLQADLAMLERIQQARN
ncbi:MAG TPA: hypothetical protein PKE59_00025 [Novosphingobium sp.]|jgi:hypothetical protein|nr:hypothetical protein [Novosphingobium sp.]